MVSEFYSKLKKLKINVKLVNGNLDLQAPKGVLNNELIDEIKFYKKDLIEFINSYKKENYSSIPKTIAQKNYPVSSSQQRLWVLSRFEEGNIAYNMPGVYVFEGDFNRQAFDHSFAALLERHENLRTIFKEDGEGELKQFINSPENAGFQVSYVDLRTDKAAEEKLQQLIQSTATKAFDLAAGPLLRAVLCQLENEKWVFIYVIHHIISDGWSMGILIKELLQLYNAHTQGVTLDLPPLRIQYKDYAIWQRSQLSGESLSNHKNYWLKQFDGNLPVLNFQGDKRRPAIKTYNGGAINKQISSKLSNEIKSLGQDKDCTLFMKLLALVNTLLYKYTAQEDIIIGSPVAGRQHADLEGQIGFFLNTLAFRTQFKGDDSFIDLLQGVKQVAVGAYEHQVYPFDDLVNVLHLQHDRSRNPLFDVSLNLNNAEADNDDRQQLGNLTVSSFAGEEPVVSRMDLIFNFVETQEGLFLRIEYNRDIYLQETIEQLSTHFVTLIESVIADPQVPIKNINFLSEEEKTQLVKSFNTATLSYPQETTLVNLFDEQVKRTPQLNALIYANTTLGYAQLNERSNQLAHYLMDTCGVKPNDLVGVMLDRSEKMIITILGILKTGAAYVPIDVDYPKSRKEFIIKDTGIKVLFAQKQEIGFDYDQLIVAVDTQLDSLDTAVHAPIVSISPDSVAYIIYTSGSTGKPKGVMITHGAIVNTILAQQSIFDVKEEDRNLQFASPSFDASVSEIFVALASGAAVYIVEEDKKKDPLQLTNYISENKIDLATIPPAYLQLLQLDQLSTLKKLVTAGEAAIMDTVQAFAAQGIYYNAYGPTETSICATIFRLNQGESITANSVPIGSSLPNVQLYILDDNNGLMPVGSIGEICVGGKGLAKGYLNNPELTAKKFIDNPFKKNDRLYKTGDLGKWLPDGNIEFFGRKDDQVKIRGYRVELGEIESALQSHPDVGTAIVVTKPNKEGEKDLVVYVLSKEKLNTTALRSYLSERLPEYMLPNHYVQLDELPLNQNGKVDKKRLPEPEGLAMSTGVEYIAPRNEIEEKLVRIWQELLDKGNVGVKDNFFELGGHSLKGTRLVSQIHKEFEVKIELIELFSKPVLEEQAELIQQARKIVFVTIPTVAPASSYPLSAAQRRLWILSQFEESNAAYNMPGIYVFEGELDREALTYCFDTLLERHESLRTVFKEDASGEVKQFIRTIDECGFKIAYHDLRDEAEEKVKALVHAEFTMPFDLIKGPLLRANLCQVENNKWIFTYVMHHIISDGWSMGVLIEELLHFYNAKVKGVTHSLPPLRIQYKEYAAWQQARLSVADLETHKAYWLDQFDGNLPVLELPTDKIRPAIKTYNGGVISKQLDPNASNGIKALSKEQGCTLFMGLLAVVNTLFYKYTSQEDIIIGSPIAGREHADLEDQIGFYVNTLALRTRFKKEDSYRELLKRTKQVTLGAYEHQIYTFDELVDALQLKRDMGRNPLFDVEVILQNNETAKSNIEQSESKLKVSGYEDAENPTSRFDMVFCFVELNEELYVSIEYNSDIYSRRIALQLADHLEQLMGAVIAQPDKEISALEFLSASEKNKLLESFNSNVLDYPQDATLVKLFDEQMKRTPSLDALIHAGISLNYEQLNEKSNQLAHYLIDTCSVKPNDLVGVMLDRSEKTIIAILGILKAGAAYVPIDADYPKSRKEFIIQDTAINVLITQMESVFNIDYFGGTMFAIDIQVDSLETPIHAPAVSVSPDSLAYVIYTSGSTGNPKGVMITHGAIVNTIFAQQSIFDVKEGDRNLQFASSSFDASVSEIFVALASGAALYIVEEGKKKDPLQLTNYITENRIDLATIPPAYLQLLQLDQLSTLKKLVTAGEAAIMDTAQAFATQGTYYNAYGPTETSICATIFQLNQGEKITANSVPIGNSLPNVQLYILDDNNGLMPAGSIGEICVGGKGLAKGYLNNAELTAKKFIDNPFKKNDRLYKTGDLGKWLPDGSIEFFGRKDDQVKIRGYRIELGEIESAVLTHPGVGAAIVITKLNKEGEKDLVVYVLSKEKLNTSELRSYLSERLPEYMLPNHYVQLDELPLNQNGKVDKKRLPEPEGLSMSTGAEYEAPRNEMERTMVAIWEEILMKEKIGINDNFFELGGDSIKILRMVAELKKELSLQIPLSDIYKNNTIAEIAAHVSQNKVSIDERNKETEEQEAVVKSELHALKERVLASGMLSDAGSIEDIYPMSDIEKGMVFASVLHKESNIYHDQSVFQRIFVDFSIERFERALQLMVEKHPILRTSFNLNDFERPVQIVRKSHKVSIPYRDLTAVNREAQERTVQQFMDSELQNPFDTSRSPIWRLAIFNFGNNEFIFVWQCHHAVIDGWSDALFLTELNNVYLKLEEDAAFEPEKLRSSYKDFIIQSETAKNNTAINGFWKQELAGCTRLDLFVKEEALSGYTSRLDKADIRKMEQVAVDLKTTVKVISLSAYLQLLQILNYDRQVVAGLVTNTRPDCEDGDKILGCFLNTIPLKMDIDENVTGVELLAMVEAKLLELKTNERLSMLEIASLHNKQHEAENPFFDVIFNYVDFHAFNSINDAAVPPVEETVELPAIHVRPNARTNTYLDFTVDRTSGAFTINFSINKKLKSGFSAEQINALYHAIIKHIIDAPTKSLYDLELLNPQERLQLLNDFNSTAHAYKNNRTLVDLFTAQVLQSPLSIALEVEERSYTYRDLNERSNQLAAYLHKQYDLKKDELVAIKLERSEWMLIAMLGILKSGAGYVPIDPSYPQDRIAYLQKDSGCKAVFDQEELERFIASSGSYSSTPTERSIHPQDLAYVIYTSGSTGQPKGVMVEHRNVVSFLENMERRFYLDPSIILGGTTNYTFDISVLELLGTVLRGIKLVLLTETDSLSILKNIGDGKITGLQVTPSRLNQLMDADPKSHELLQTLKVLLIGGESLSTFNYDRLKALPSTNVIHVYGPTETTIWSSSMHLQSSSGLSIGVPLLNEEMHILTSHHQLCGIGLIGEICIGGEGVARGYLNRPELTAEKFIASSFQAGERLYKTGDLGRRLATGEIAFIGRKDDQVKLRGYRIELGEIENALQRHPQVDAAVVLVKPNGAGEDELIGYVTGKETLNTSALLNYLSNTLPVYMLPSHFVQLASFPLTSSGKIDRRSLPAPGGLSMSTGVKYVAPRNETEEKLVAIWEELLEKEKIGIHDNFFELGGHSLKVMRLAGQLHRVFDVKIELRALFENFLLIQQAQLIQQTKKTAYSSIAPVATQPSYVLSSAQRRLWILSQFEERNIAYNMPGVYIMEGVLNEKALAHAFRMLLERHEILRIVFKENEKGEINQFIHAVADSGFKIKYKDLRMHKKQEEKLKQLIQKEFQQPFDLSSSPLLRAKLYQVADDKWIFIYVMHHIISDGWSMGILHKEMLEFYHARITGTIASLPPLRIQYKDYAAWQQEELNSSGIEIHKAYWLKQLEGTLPVLELAGDKTRPAIKTYNGGIIRKQLNSSVSKGIRAFSQQQDATLFMGLLAAVNALLYRYSHQEDIIIGTPIAGREHADLENQIGFYINTLALRTRFKGSDSFKELLSQLKQVTVDAYEHQLYPFDALVDALHLERDMSRSPLFDVMVLLQHQEKEQVNKQQDTAELKLNRYEGETTQWSKFDLLFDFIEAEETVSLNIEYNSDIYGQEMVTQLADHFEQLLAALLAQPHQSIQELEFISENEKKQLLETFNDTTLTYQTDKTVIDLFDEQVKKTPKAIALVFEETKLTYKQLNERSNRLAGYLQQHYQLKADELVGIKLERSEWMIVVLLGILKSGAAYLPIDTNHPEERINYMIEDSQCKVVIDEQELEKFRKEEARYRTYQPTATHKINDLAYVIYTSGSTGKPKGVMIEHRSLMNLIASQCLKFGIDKKENILQFSSLSFDASVEQIFIALTSGARLTLISKEALLDPEGMEEFIAANKITHVHAVPSFLKTITAKKYPALRRIIAGGDACPLSLITAWSKHHTFYNEYGPTETTVTITEQCYKKGEKIHSAASIGQPIGNTKMFIVTANNKLCPLGVAGEICISGRSLARGYLNQPALTAEKFMTNPFDTTEKIYRTGDLGRWLADGNIEFIGRKDDQVKIRGYRIELGEIERALQLVTDVETATVVAKVNKNGEKELLAYVVGKGTLNIASIREHISKTIPAYMIPNHFVELEQLPLTSSGKVDKKQLPAPEGLDMLTGRVYVAARNKMEMLLVAAYEEVLKKKPVGIEEGFFELGGDSIKLIQIVSYLKQRGYYLTIRDVFSHPAIQELAHQVKKMEATAGQATVGGLTTLNPSDLTFKNVNPQQLEELINKLDIEDAFPVSDMQKILIEEYEKDIDFKGVYHPLSSWTFTDDSFSLTALKEAIRLLQEKHPALRTVFLKREEEHIVQCIRKPAGSALRVEDIATLSAAEQKIYIQHAREADVKNKFNINEFQEALVRFTVFMLSDKSFELMFSCHHAIVDGWGFTVFQNELLDYYIRLRNGEKIVKTPVPNSLKEHVYLSEKTSDSKDANDFWMQELQNRKPVSGFKKRATGKTNSTDFCTLQLNETAVKRLKTLAGKNNVSLRAVFLGTSLHVLRNEFKAPDLSFSVVFNGRTIELSDPLNSMGLFWNMLPFSIASGKELMYQDVQDKLNNSEEFSRFSAWKIRQNLGAAADLVSFVYTDFHNAKDWTGEQAIPNNLPVMTDAFSVDKYHYPLNIKVGVNRGNQYDINLRIDYDQTYFQEKEIENLLKKINEQLAVE